MKKILLYLILLMAVIMAGIVAYVSVTGLLKVFTGAGTLGLMLFTIIEVAKVVATMAIHTYSKVIGWVYTGLISIFIGVAMLITSMGIYGFLSSSYKDSFAQMENINSKVELLNEKKRNFDEQLASVREEKTSINTTISELTKGLSNNVIQYKDASTGQIITTTSSTTRKALEKQLEKANGRIVGVTSKSDSLSNLVYNIENEILELKLDNSVASELSSLQYLADVTGQSMDDVMKWFILLLIIIGDPMAVIMVIIFSKVINKQNNTKPTTKKKLKVGNDKDEDHFEPLETYGIVEKEKAKPEFEDIVEPELEDTMEPELEDTMEPELEDTMEPELEDIMEPEPPTRDNKINGGVKIFEEQIKENKEKFKEKIRREDIKEIKEQGTRGYSVDVPTPDSNTIHKVRTNKEVRKTKPNHLFFNRANK